VLAKRVKSGENRPVSTALNDQQSVTTIKTYDPTTELDLWSVNVYRGCDFGFLFQEFQSVSTRPLFVSEFGIDAYDDSQMSVNEKVQADCYASQWSEIVGNSSVVIGGAITEYVDEYWKSKLAQADAKHPRCPNYDPSVQLNCGYPNDNFPDKYANQAYFGIVDYQFQPRQAYKQLQALWKEK